MSQDASDAILKQIPILPFDFGLVLYNSTVTSLEVEKLAHLDKLTYSHITGGDVNFDGLDESTDLTDLVFLSPVETDVIDSELAFVAQLKSLKALTFFLINGELTTRKYNTECDKPGIH